MLTERGVSIVAVDESAEALSQASGGFLDNAWISCIFIVTMMDVQDLDCMQQIIPVVERVSSSAISRCVSSDFVHFILTPPAPKQLIYPYVAKDYSLL